MALGRRTRAALAAYDALPHLGVCLVDAGNGVLATTVAQFTLRLDACDRPTMVPVAPLKWTVDRACVAAGVRRPTDGTYEQLAGGPVALGAGDSVTLDDYARVIR